jgi:hypothetical protein
MRWGHVLSEAGWAWASAVGWCCGPELPRAGWLVRVGLLAVADQAEQIFPQSPIHFYVRVISHHYCMHNVCKLSCLSITFYLQLLFIMYSFRYDVECVFWLQWLKKEGSFHGTSKHLALFIFWWSNAPDPEYYTIISVVYWGLSGT